MKLTGAPRVTIGAALLAIVVAATTIGVARSRVAAPATDRRPDNRAALTSQSYARAVTQICTGALLFEHAHPIVTEADARAVARDIRRSTGRRVARITAIPPPPVLRTMVARWLSLERQLAASYAANWVRIHLAIDAARTPAQRARLAGLLHRFVHAPDALRVTASRLETRLGIPDCTGGSSVPRPQLSAVVGKPAAHAA